MYYNEKIAYFISITAICILLISKTGHAQMAGNYLIDPNGNGDYTSLNEAVNSLHQEGMNAAVVLQLASGTYSEKIKLDSVIGNTAEHQIVIESQSGSAEDVTISYQENNNDTSNYVIRLRSTQGVTIRNITFNTSEATSDFGRVIELVDFTNNTLIEGNRFFGNRNSSAIMFGAGVAGDFYYFLNPDSISHLTIRENFFTLFSPAIDSRTAFLLPDVYHSDIIIEENNFMDCDGINLSNVNNLYFGDNFCQGKEYRVKPMVLSSIGGDILIEKNRAYTTLEGFSISNIIASQSNPALIVNNFISGTDVLMKLSTLDNINIAHNSLVGTSTNNSILVLFQTNRLNLYNNIFYNKSEGALLMYYEIANLNSDYNCYYSPAGTYGIDFLRQESSLESYEDFTSYFDIESNGLNIDPNLVSDTSYQSLATALIDAGVPLSYVIEDIEGEARNDGKPDIGANESTLLSNLSIVDIGTSGSSVNVDEALTISWSGENIGETTFSSIWQDHVYLSRDTQLDEEDIFLGFKINEVTLAPGEPYTFSKAFIIDLDEAGAYYVLVKINANEALQEDKTDNVLAGPQITVNFTNRPNLMVSGIELPTKTNSGALLTFDWTVTNNGDQPTTENWYDYIYFSSDLDKLTDHENFNPEENFVAKIKNPIGLAPGESYTNSHQLVLPVRGSGQYYVKVITDYENSQDELDESLSDNATVSDAVSVEQTPLSDFVVTSLNFPETAFSGEWIDFSYTIKNAGIAKTSYDLWTDYLYLTTDSIPDRDTFRNGWSFRQQVKNWKELEIGEEFVVQDKIKLPYCQADTFFVYLLVDIEDEIIEISEDNNVVTGNQPLIVVHKPNADLVVERLMIPDPPLVTETVARLEYDVYNRGLDVANIFNDLQDAIYLSEDQEFDAETDIRLTSGWFFDTLALAIDDKITRQMSVKWPDSLFGEFYVVVYTDDVDEFCEVPYEDNNAFFSERLTIELAPAKDLTIENLVVQTSGVASEKMTITYDLLNNGVGNVQNKNLIDSIYLVPENDMPDKHNFVWIKEREAFSLASKTSLPEELYFSIPIKIPPGDYQLVVFTDATKQVYEHEAEQNNLVRSSVFSVTRDDNKLPDLDIQNVVLPSKILSGTQATISFDLANLSTATTNTDEWKYRLILINSENKSIDQKQYLHFGNLEGNTSVSESFDFSIPDGISGDYQLAIQADVNYKVFEYYKGNNADTIDIEIELSPWADLNIQNFSYPDTLVAGQLADLSWEVRNSGLGNTKADILSDRVFASEDNILDKNDILLYKTSYEDLISAGGSLIQPAEFRVASDVNGLYYLIIQTDAADQEYEHTDEDNNTTHSSQEVFILRPKPIDLAPFPSSIVLSSGFGRVDYGVLNAGPNTAYGSWIDAAFLSEDEIWDSSDILMGYRTVDAGEEGLDPGASYTNFIRNEAGFLKPADYYIIIKSDVFNYMPETNSGNNNRASESTFYIDMIEELIPGVQKDSVYNFNGYRTHYYKMKTKTDKGYLLTMDGKNSNNSTELFYKVEDLPDRGGNFDYKGANDFQEVQQIIVPSKDSLTTDFVLAYGDYVFGKTMDYTLMAEEKEFSIISITPEFGGNEGNVVMDINGFDFSDSLKISLRNVSDTLVATHSIGVSNTKSRAHFNTNFIDPGIYDVVLSRLDRGDETVFEQAFEVQDTTYLDYYLTVTGPDRARTGREIITQVNFANQGNINDYDLFIVVGFFMNKFAPEDFSIDYLGDGISDDLPEELQGLHPFTNDVFFQDENAYYFATWLPVLAAQSSGQFTFKISSDVIDSLTVSAQIFANPISEIHFTGNLDDLKKTRFIQDLEVAFNNELNGISNGRVAGECIDDPKQVEAMIWKGVRAHAEYVGGGIPSNRTEAIAAMVQEGLKSFIDPEAHNRAGGVVNDLIDEQREVVLDPTKKSAYDHLIKNLDNCLTPELTDEISQCLEGNKIPYAGGGYQTVYTNTCIQRPPPKQPNNPSIPEKIVNWVTSLDPNEIIGPEGTGDPRYISENWVLDYRINFENVADAAASAQRVAIENELKPEMDERSFRLKEIGWNDTTIQLPQAAYFSGKFDLGEKYNNYQLQLTAGIDAVNRRAFWRFQTIDPATGAPPDDPDAGFLPPNDSTGIGEGFVSYIIKSKNALPGGTEIANDAVIVFDREKSLQTNTWINTIQGDEGIESFVMALDEEMDTTRFVVAWQPDNIFNAYQPDITDYTIYVAKDEGQYEIWQLNTKETEAIFTGERGSSYEFYSIARSASGLSEYTPLVADASTRIAEVKQVTGLEDLQNDLKQNNLVIYPNPSKGLLEIGYRIETKERTALSILTLSGRSVYHELIDHTSPGTYYKNLGDLSTLSNGIYIIKMEGTSFSEAKKWIKE